MAVTASAEEAHRAGRVRGGFARVLPWLALLIVGEVARLQLIDAGPLVAYQHYKGPGALLLEVPVATAIVALQGVGVAVRLRRLWPKIRAWLSSAYGRRAAIVITLFIMTSAALSKDPSVYGAELVVASLLQSIALATVFIAAVAVPENRLSSLAAVLRRLVPEDDGIEPRGVDRFALAAAAWVTIVCVFLAVFSYQRHPHVPDEVSYILQARYFLDGVLAMPAPPVRAAFDLDLMTYEATRWYSPFPPGWGAILSLGVLAGTPWLVNPIINGMNLLLAHVLIAYIYGRRTARWGDILLCTSPWFLFMGMNLMSHTLSLFGALIAAVSVARLRRSGRNAWAIPGGVAIGMVSIIRPLEGVALAVVLGTWTLGVRGQRFRFMPLATLATAAMIAGAAILPYHKALTGKATTFPVMAYMDLTFGKGTNALGFGANRGAGWQGLDPLPGHGIADVFINANLNTFQVNVELLGWSIGSLLVIWLLLFSRRMQRADMWLLASVAVVVGLHSFYWFSGGPDFGARYWYLIIVPCIALTARGIEMLEQHRALGTSGSGIAGRDSARWPGAAARDHRVTFAALALCGVAMLAYIPWRAVNKYYHYRLMQPGVEALARKHNFGTSLVLIRGKRHPDYMSAGVYNPLDLRAPAPVYAWDKSLSVREEVLQAYPDRPVWIVNGPSVTGNGFEVVAGPLAPADALVWQGSAPHQ